MIATTVLLIVVAFVLSSAARTIRRDIRRHVRAGMPVQRDTIVVGVALLVSAVLWLTVAASVVMAWLS